jgi:hypothetical protein
MCVDPNGCNGKEEAIQNAIDAQDAWKLRELALTEGGFVNGACVGCSSRIYSHTISINS